MGAPVKLMSSIFRSSAAPRAREAVVETGRLLIQAKAELPDGSFEGMVDSMLPFSLPTGARSTN